MEAYPIAAMAMLGMGAKKGAGKVKDWVKDRNGKNSSESSETGNTSPVLVNSSKGIESNTELSNHLLQEIADNTSENSSSLMKIAKAMIVFKVIKSLLAKQGEFQNGQKKDTSVFRKGSAGFDAADQALQKRSNFISVIAGGMDLKQWKMDSKAYTEDKARAIRMHKDQAKAEGTREKIEESDVSRNRRLKVIADSLGAERTGEYGGGSGGDPSKRMSFEDEEREMAAERAEEAQRMRGGKAGSGYIMGRRRKGSEENLDFVGPHERGSELSDGEVIRQNDRAETYERNIGFMKGDDAANEMGGVSTSDYISKEGAKLDGAEGPSEIKNAIVDGTNAVTGIMGNMLDFSSRTWDLDKRNEKLDKKIHALEKREKYLERTRKLEAGKLGADGSKTAGFGNSDKISELIKRLKEKKEKGGGLLGSMLGGGKKLLGGAGKGLLGAVAALAAGKGLKSAFGAFGAKSGAVDAVKNAKAKGVEKVTKIKDAVKGKVNKVKSKASSIKSAINKNEDVKTIKKGASKKASELKGKASNWWNKGKDSKSNMKSLGGKESKAPWKKLLANDKAQITKNKVSQIGKGMKGWNPLKAFSPKMMKTGPTPAVRQAVERPIGAAKKFGGNLVEKAKGLKGQGIGNVAKGGMQAAKSGIGSVARGAMTVGRAGLAAAPGALSAAGGAIASGASAAAGAAGSAMSGIGALAAANPIGAAVLATAAIGAGGYMLWDTMRGSDEAKEAFDAAEDAGLVDHDVIGNSEILDWEGIKKLSPKALDGLIEYDDWSSEDMDKLKQIKESGEIDDKITKKKQEVKKDERVANRVERKSESVNGRHQMMTDEEGNTSMTKHNFGRAGIKERNAMLATGSRQATRDEVDQLVDDTRDKADDSASELRALEARKIELNKSGDKLKQGQGESGVSGQTNNAPVILSSKGGNTSNNSSVTNNYVSEAGNQRPSGMGQTNW
jgi:hypothetical protein